MSTYFQYTYTGGPIQMPFVPMQAFDIDVWVNGIKQKDPHVDAKNSLELNVAQGSIIEVQRRTPLERYLPTKEKDEDIDAPIIHKKLGRKLHGIYCRFQEVDTYLERVPLITSQGVDMKKKPLRNCGTPEKPSDGTTVQWVNDVLDKKLQETENKFQEKLDTFTEQLQTERNQDKEYFAKQVFEAKVTQHVIEGHRQAVDKLVARLEELGLDTASHAGASNHSHFETQRVAVQFKDAVQEYAQNLSRANSLVQQGLTQHQGNLMTEIAVQGETITKYLETLLQRAQTVDGELTQKVQKVYQYGQEVSSNIDQWHNVSSEATTHFTTLLETGNQEIKDATQKAIDGVDGKSIEVAAKIITDKDTALKALDDKSTEIAATIETNKNAALKAVEDKGAEATTTIETNKNTAIEGLREESEEIKTNIQAATEDAVDTLEQKKEETKAHIESASNTATTKIETDKSNALNELKTQGAEIKAQIENTANTLMSGVSTLKTKDDEAKTQEKEEHNSNL